jgi:hypothetical protein
MLALHVLGKCLERAVAAWTDTSTNSVFYSGHDSADSRAAPRKAFVVALEVIHVGISLINDRLKTPHLRSKLFLIGLLWKKLFVPEWAVEPTMACTQTSLHVARDCKQNCTLRAVQ